MPAICGRLYKKGSITLSFGSIQLYQEACKMQQDLLFTTYGRQTSVKTLSEGQHSVLTKGMLSQWNHLACMASSPRRAFNLCVRPWMYVYETIHCSLHSNSLHYDSTWAS